MNDRRPHPLRPHPHHFHDRQRGHDHAAKTHAVHRLGLGLCQRTGIKMTAQTEAKLLRIFGKLPPGRLLDWVSELERLPHNHPEWLAVIENLTVHETFFFRDGAQFEMLRRSVLPHLVAAAAAKDRRLRVWSAGCASGEEAYTVAILLMETLLEMGEATGTPETGISPARGWRVEVVGTDISRHMVEIARQGLYLTGEMSAFRSLPSPYERWFEDVFVDEAGGQARRRVRPWLKSFTRFQQLNLAFAEQPPEANFQLVLCRNVFIYLSVEAQNAAQTAFSNTLQENGVLVLGATDRLALPEHFQTEWDGDSMVYRRLPRS
ncbi:MAG: protein-glutamate O-methyltransferase CheR [Alphaproteobacteria bacterium]|nr:protein-glutamate O-methyltransferase CheR [Alphaproteobacteria bacterium]